MIRREQLRLFEQALISSACTGLGERGSSNGDLCDESAEDWPGEQGLFTPESWAPSGDEAEAGGPDRTLVAVQRLEKRI